MRDSESKQAWEAQNVLLVACKVNRNQNPELFRLLSEAESRGALARELMQEALDARKAKLGI